MRWSEIGVLMGSLEGVALLAGLQAHNLLWRKCARCVSDDSIDYESREAVLLYTEWWRNVYPQHAQSPIFMTYSAHGSCLSTHIILQIT